jgi:predicted TIM-barrel fold metal-dependent hydrolase
VLFGTDWPGASIAGNLKAFRSIDLSDEAKQKILWANGSRILGLEG